MKKFTQILTALSLCYLLLPYLIFFVGYLKWPFALLMSSCAIAGTITSVWHLRRSKPASKFSAENEATSLTLTFFIALVFSVFGCVLISGIGGYGYQDHDWYKHNAILSALILHDWPVAYHFVQSSAPASSVNIPVVY